MIRYLLETCRKEKNCNLSKDSLSFLAYLWSRNEGNIKGEDKSEGTIKREI